MAATKLNAVSPIIAIEAVTIGVSAESLVTAGATIPSNTGEIWGYVPASDNIHWLPNGTPTTTVGHAVTANKWFMLTHAQHGSLIVSDDGADINLLVAYMRGAGSALSNASNAVPN